MDHQNALLLAAFFPSGQLYLCHECSCRSTEPVSPFACPKIFHSPLEKGSFVTRETTKSSLCSSNLFHAGKGELFPTCLGFPLFKEKLEELILTVYMRTGRKE